MQYMKNRVYIYIDYIYIYNKIVIKAVEPEGEAAHIKQSNAIYENRVYIYRLYIYITR